MLFRHTPQCYFPPRSEPAGHLSEQCRLTAYRNTSTSCKLISSIIGGCQMPTRSKQYSLHEKVIFVTRAILSREGADVLCRKKDISPRTYYNWRNCFIKVCEQ